MSPVTAETCLIDSFCCMVHRLGLHGYKTFHLNDFSMTIITYRKDPQTLRFNKSLNGNVGQFASLYKEKQPSIPVNISETETDLVLEVIAPGLAKEDFKISMDKNLLTITVDKENEAAKENVKTILREYNFRSFERSFTLSENVDQERISAKYVNGILTLNFGKKDAVKPLKKEIKIS